MASKLSEVGVPRRMLVAHWIDLLPATANYHIYYRYAPGKYVSSQNGEDAC